MLIKMSTCPAVEHATVEPSTAQNNTPRRRPDLSSFFSTLDEITPQPDDSRTRPHAVPVPADMRTTYALLADAYGVMQRSSREGGHGGSQEDVDDELLTNMIHILQNGADAPPREVQGVSEEFCDGMYYMHTFAFNTLADLRYSITSPRSSPRRLFKIDRCLSDL